MPPEHGNSLLIVSSLKGVVPGECLRRLRPEPLRVGVVGVTACLLLQIQPPAVPLEDALNVVRKKVTLCHNIRRALHLFFYVYSM